MLGWLMNKLRPIEERSSGGGYTAQVMAARDSFISGRRGVAELTATVQSCVSLWEGGFAMADVTGTGLLTRQVMARIARAVALRMATESSRIPFIRASGSKGLPSPPRSTEALLLRLCLSFTTRVAEGRRFTRLPLRFSSTILCAISDISPAAASYALLTLTSADLVVHPS